MVSRRPKDQLPKNADAYWQRPPARDKGDEKPEPLWQAIGSSVTTWEMIEDTFAVLFRLLVESQSSAASRAYGAIASARGRREALMAAAEIFFEIHKVAELWREEFDLLMQHFAKASGRRNEIAHGISIRYMHGEEDPTAIGIFLIPAAYNTSKRHPFMPKESEDKFAHLQSKYRYTAEDISQITSKFHHLNGVASEWLLNFWDEHVAKPRRK